MSARAWQFAACVVGTLLIAAAHADTPWQPLGPWRIEDGRVAPWATPATKIDPAYRGRPVRFESDRVVAAAPLGCERARYEWLFPPPEGLFEGLLSAPASEAARRLGLVDARIPTLRVTCANAGFDFHRTRDGALLLGLDGVVWTLRATAAPSSPSSVVELLLLEHFTHDMAFTRESVAAKRAFLSPALSASLDAWFAVPEFPDEVPAISGDPFTDTQEYPERFSLGALRTAQQHATVPVHFADERSQRRVDYVLVRDGAHWLVDDLADERGQSLRALLRPATDDFDAFLARFRAALGSGRAQDVAALVRAPFLYEGRELDRDGIARIVPELFTPAVKRCLATARATSEDDRRVAFCSPYAFYFGRVDGSYRLVEFAADGEDAP